MRLHRTRAKFLSIATTLLVIVVCSSAAQASTLDLIGQLHRTLVSQEPKITQASVKERNDKFRTALEIYLNERTPTNPTQRDAFLGNVLQMLTSLSQKELQKLDEDIARPMNKPASKNSAQFNQCLDAVAYYTVAADDVIVGLGDDEPPSWSRRPENNPRKANITVDWAKVRNHFNAHRLRTDVAFGRPTSPSNASTADASAWITVLRERMARLYGSDPAVEFTKDPAFVADVARAYYLMVGTRSNDNNDRELRSIDLLRPLADRLDPQVPGNAANADNELDRVLSTTEQAFGFRQGDLMPTGILSAQEFFQIIAAGYLPNDVGAEVAHGSLTHRFQWNMLMTDFDQADNGSWHYTPLDLFTRIGQFDLRRDQVNREQRFAFERLPAVWAQLFDEQGERIEDAVFTRPDSMLGILERSPSLKRIAERVKLMRKERINEGLDLLAAVEDQTTDWTQRDWRPDLRAVRERIAQRVAREAVADELYQERYFDRARKGGTYKVVQNPDGSDSNLLIRKEFDYRSQPNQQAIDNLRVRNQTKLARSSSTASTSDDPVRFRDRDQTARSTTSSTGNHWEGALRREVRRTSRPTPESSAATASTSDDPVRFQDRDQTARSTASSAGNHWEGALRREARRTSRPTLEPATDGSQTTESQEPTRRDESAAHSDINSTHFPAVPTDSLEQDPRRLESTANMSGRTRGETPRRSGSRERVPLTDAP